jgi:hypothetical protein
MNTKEAAGLCIDPGAEPGLEHYNKSDIKLGKLGQGPGTRDGDTPQSVPNNNRDTFITVQTSSNGSQSPEATYTQRIDPVTAPSLFSNSASNPQHISGSDFQSGTTDVHTGNGYAGNHHVNAMSQNQQNPPSPTYVPLTLVPNPEPFRWQSLFPQQKLWRYTMAIAFFVLLAVIIALSILFANSKNNHIAATNDLQVTTFQPSNVLPIVGSGLGAAEIILGTYFSTSSADKPQTKVIYDGGNGKICIRTKLGTIWLDKIRCVEGANPKSLTPLTICDWIGGPSGAFINTDGYLSSINYVPKNDTWVLSSLADQKIAPHQKSRLASVTWLNGTSIWIYYQGSDGQLREYGMDDYRDKSWREGSAGPLGKTQEGSSYGVSRYVIDDQEVEEVFFQATNGAIHGRRYANSVWETEVYTVDGTATGVPFGASLTMTTITQANNSSMLLLAYIATSGFLTIQARRTGNVTTLGSFAKPKQVVQGDGHLDTGLAADGSMGVPRVYLLKNLKILMLESDLAMANWTTTDITSS